HNVTIFFSSRRRHTRFSRDWSSDVCSSDLEADEVGRGAIAGRDIEQSRAGLNETALVAEPGELVGHRGTAERLHEAQQRLQLHRSEERRVGKEYRSWWVSMT